LQPRTRTFVDAGDGGDGSADEAIDAGFGSDFASDEAKVQPVNRNSDVTEHAEVALRRHPIIVQVCVGHVPGNSPMPRSCRPMSALSGV
jgi:hypothetical protein